MTTAEKRARQAGFHGFADAIAATEEFLRPTASPTMLEVREKEKRSRQELHEYCSRIDPETGKLAPPEGAEDEPPV